MQRSVLGEVLENNLSTISTHYPDVAIPLHIVMPNHFHAIIVISGEADTRAADNLGRLNQTARITVATGGDPTMSIHHNCRLGNVISGIKAHVTRFAGLNNIPFGWQDRYHDHIIRNTADGNTIAKYIKTNVERWSSDCFHS